MSKKNYNRIKAVLADQDKSNKDLAKMLNVANQTVSRWCTNTGQPTVEMLFKIAKALRCSVRDLLVDFKG